MKKLFLLFIFLSLTTSIFSQVSKTVNLVAAGALSSSLTSNELTTITNLTLTGTMDARDFRTMSADMPLLAVLDLSGVTIAAYTGTVGTDTNSYEYPANGIPYCAFYNAITPKIRLTTIVFPSSLSSIGDYAFSGCKGLTTVTIPSSVTSIGESAFAWCSGLTIVSIPSSVTSIGANAFRICIGLTTVTIPSSVTSIGEEAFKGCSALTVMTVDANNPIYSSLDGVLYNKTQTTLIDCPNGKTGNFTIPSSVTSIGVGAFSVCTGLTSVTIPSSVTSIENGAFGLCSGLTTVTIPSSVTSIGKSAFILCSGLTTISIPSSVTSIGEKVFEGCRGLTTITIPSSVTSIGVGAFSVCTGLTTITIPSSVTSIGERAFAECTGLTTITIPSSVTSIGERAFEACTGLTSITTTRLTPFNFGESPAVFSMVNKTSCTLYVPFGSKSAYQVADQWKDFKNIVEKVITGIEPIINDQKLTISPNPTTGKIKVVFNQIPKKGTTLSVNDFTGKTILTQHIQNKEEQIDLGGNLPGVYLIRTNMKDFKIQKVVLK